MEELIEQILNKMNPEERMQLVSAIVNSTKTELHKEVQDISERMERCHESIRGVESTLDALLRPEVQAEPMPTRRR